MLRLKINKPYCKLIKQKGDIGLPMARTPT